MIKTPLSIAIGGVGFYTKNAVVIGAGHKSEPEKPFDIASLFENGEHGLWLDPNNLSTLFQDVGCTVPITATDQTAGYVYDSSRNSDKRVNLLTDTVFSKDGSSLSSRGGTLSFGILDNHKYVVLGKDSTEAYSFAYMKPQTVMGATYTFSVELWAEDGSSIDLTNDCRVVTNGDAVAATLLDVQELGNGKVRVHHTFVATKASVNCGVVKYSTSTDKAICASKYQVELGTEATKYQPVGPLNEWDGKFGVRQGTSSFQARYALNGETGYAYLSFDGVDDNYVTDYLDFTHTDCVTVVAAFEKLSDTGIGIIAEFSDNSVTNTGVFGLGAPFTAANNVVGFRSRGTNHANTLSNVVAAPAKLVAVGRGDISLSLNSLRVNKAEFVQSVSQGEVNFGKYPLFIGRRGGISNAFSGNLYGLLIIDRILTDAEIQKVEAEFAKRMGITL